MQKLSALLDFKKAAKAAVIAIPALALSGCVSLNVSSSGEITQGEVGGFLLGGAVVIAGSMILDAINNNNQQAPAYQGGYDNNYVAVKTFDRNGQPKYYRVPANRVSDCTRVGNFQSSDYGRMPAYVCN